MAESRNSALPDVLAGKTFGRYRVQKLVGEGAMGAVYLAEDPELQRQVALKLPKFSPEESPELMQRFLREARSAATLNHPHICPVYDFGTEEGTPFITMAYIEGMPLSRLVGTPEYREQRRIAGLVRTLAGAMSAAHAAGILHRDLKSGNVLIDEKGEPILTDFGLARRADDAEESRITKEGGIAGTPAYMSPEQLDGTVGEIGPQSDIYSLGVVLFELLTGELPFTGSVASVAGQVLRDRPPRPSDLRQKVDKDLESICLRMLEKRPQERFTSMDNVAAALKTWLARRSEKKGAEKRARERRDKLEAKKREIVKELKRGQFAAAIKGLETMIQLTGPQTEAYVKWAKEELPRVKSLPQELRDNLEDAIVTAKRLIAGHDYGQAAEILQEFPAEYRSEEADRLVDEAISRQDEVDLLIADLQDATRAREYEGLLDNVKRLLELKPGHRTARELFETLKTYEAIPAGQKKYRHDEKGRLLPARTGFGGKLTRGSQVAIALGVLAFIGAVWGLMVLFQERERIVELDIAETLLADDSVTLWIDGKERELSGPGQTLALAPGEYEYELRRGSVVVIPSRRFLVGNDGKARLTISAPDEEHVPNEDEPQLAADDQPVESLDPFPEGLPKEAMRLEGLGRSSRSLAFTQDGTRLVSGNGVWRDPDGTRHNNSPNNGTVWDLATGKPLLQLNGPMTTLAHSIAVSPDDRYVLLGTGLAEKPLSLWDLTTGEHLRQMWVEGEPVTVWALAFAPDGRTAAAGQSDGKVRLWNVETGENVLTLQGHTQVVQSVPFLAGGEQLVTSSRDGLRRWHALTGRELASVTVPDAGNLFLAVAPGEEYSAVSAGGEVKRWDHSSARLEPTPIAEHEEDIRGLLFLHGGDRLATGSMDGTVKIWEWETGRLLWTSDVHNGYINSSGMAISPDETLLATCTMGHWSGNRTTGGEPFIRLWRLAEPATDDEGSESATVELPSVAGDEPETSERLAEGEYRVSLAAVNSRNPDHKHTQRGFPHPDWFFLNPDDDGEITGRFALHRKYETFAATPRIRTPRGGRSSSRFTFSVLCDGELLWESQPISSGTEQTPCDVDVEGVRILALKVRRQGRNDGSTAFWHYPRLQWTGPATTGDSSPVPLSTLESFDHHHGPWPISFWGAELLSMHPPQRGESRVKFFLGKQHEWFSAAVRVGLGGANPIQPASAVTFHVYGDGNLLWKSAPFRDGVRTEDVGVDVSRVETLELRVSCSGNQHAAHAYWRQPYLSAAPAETIDFDFQNDNQGWVVGHEMTPVSVRNGVLVSRVQGADPFLLRKRLNIEPDRYSKLVLRMKTPKGTTGQVFWATEAELSFTASKHVSFPTIGDGEFHEYVIDVGARPQWKGQRIRQLRLDPNQGESTVGETVEIDFLRGE